MLGPCFFGGRGFGQVGGQASKILEVGNLLALDDEILNVKKSRNRKQELFIHFFCFFPRQPKRDSEIIGEWTSKMARSRVNFAQNTASRDTTRPTAQHRRRHEDGGTLVHWYRTRRYSTEPMCTSFPAHKPAPWKETATCALAHNPVETVCARA